MELASGLLNLIPGFGWIASAIIDVVTITRDFKTTKEERAAQGTGIFGKMFGGIKEWFKANGMTILKSLPFIGSILYFWEAYSAGFTTPEGIKKTITAFASILGAGPLVESAVNGLFSLFGEKEEEPSGQETSSPGGRSFFQIAKEFVIKSISKLPYFLRKPLEWLGIIKSAGSESEESWMSQGIDKSKEVGKQVLEKMSEFGSGIKDWFVDTLPKAKEAGKQVLEKMSEFGSGVKGWFSEKISEGREKSQEIIANITKSGEAIFNAASDVAKNIRDNVEKGIGVLKNTLVSVFNEMEETANKIIDWVKGIFNWINDKMGTFLSNIINIFDPAKQEGKPPDKYQEKFSKDTVINVKGQSLDIIADNSNKQVRLLEIISSKLDNISFPAPSPSAPGSPAEPTTGLGTSLTRGFGGSSLLSMDSLGSLA
jgi:hypothetical protein